MIVARGLALSVVLAVLLLSSSAHAADFETLLVSRAAMGIGNGSSNTPSISADGRFVAFTSEASNLHPDDVDATRDVFVRDMATSQVTLVSRADGPSGAKGSGASDNPRISPDGRYVVFTTEVSLSPDDAGTGRDTYMRDLVASTTTLVSKLPGGAGAAGSGPTADISADGRFVVFDSGADNLTPDSESSFWAVFIRDMVTGAIELVSRASGVSGPAAEWFSSDPRVSSDGRFVAFLSTANNLDGGSGDLTDVFVRDRAGATTVLASRASTPSGSPGNGGSGWATISADGRLVAFSSTATNLDPSDADPAHDVFVRDLNNDTTTLVSRAAGPAGVKGDGQSNTPELSRDGRFVAFTSVSSNIMPGGPANHLQVFVRSLSDGAVDAVSRQTGVNGMRAGGWSPAISSDGRFVAFASNWASFAPGDQNGNLFDVYRRERLPFGETSGLKVSGAWGNFRTRVGLTRGVPITLTNTGSVAAAVGVITASNAEFTTTDNRCSGTTLVPGASCIFLTTFAPKREGSGSAILAVEARYDYLLAPDLADILKVHINAYANAAPKPKLKRFTPFFGTTSSKRRVGGRIGTLVSLAHLTAVPRRAKVELRCVRSCRSRLRKTVRWTGKVVNLRLPLTRATVLQIRVTAPNGAKRTQRYRFFTRPGGVFGKRISG